jgi:hypothetical protein
MVRIKARTMAALAQGAVDAFVAELTTHVRDFAPCATSLTEEDLRLAIRAGMARAATRGFEQKGTVRFYLDTMIVLGSGFDTDPQVPWAADILADGRYRAPMDRAEALHARLVEHLTAVGGGDGAHARDALARLAAELRRGPRMHRSRFEEETLRLLAGIHPRKLAESGEAPIQRLIAAGVAGAGGREPGYALARIALMFAFGHQFDADPWLPWMSAGLRQDQVTTDQAAEWLERVLSWQDPASRRREVGS